MTTKEVALATGIAEPTVLKYAKILNITHYGTGRRKVFDWRNEDIEELRKSLGKRGRPKKVTEPEAEGEGPFKKGQNDI